MKWNRATFFLIFLLQLFFVSCSKCQNTKQIAGRYVAGVEGFLIPNSKVIDNGKRFLQLNEDNTFTLFESEHEEYTKSAILGTWEIKSCKTVGPNNKYIESILEFKIKDKKCNAKCLGGKKIIFDNPEEFYGNKSKIFKVCKTFSNYLKKLLLTAVTRNGEKCAKFTFIFRKKFYLSRKYAVPKFATSCSRETLTTIIVFRKRKNNKNYCC